MSHTYFIVAVPDEVDFQTHLQGIPVHVCGVGKINAALGAYDLIRKGASHLINIGSCGSRQHQVGEILKIGRVYQDIDASPLSDYGLTPFEDTGLHIELDHESPASCFTTDYFFDHSQHTKYSPHYLQRIRECSAFDMELFSIAKVCQRLDVKCSAFKWVSDDGDFTDWKENCRISLDRLLHTQFF